jgi:hypothetical protein
MVRVKKIENSQMPRSVKKQKMDPARPALRDLSSIPEISPEDRSVIDEERHSPGHFSARVRVKKTENSEMHGRSAKKQKMEPAGPAGPSRRDRRSIPETSLEDHPAVDEERQFLGQWAKVDLNAWFSAELQFSSLEPGWTSKPPTESPPDARSPQKSGVMCRSVGDIAEHMASALLGDAEGPLRRMSSVSQSLFMDFWKALSSPSTASKPKKNHKEETRKSTPYGSSIQKIGREMEASLHCDPLVLTRFKHGWHAPSNTSDVAPFMGQGRYKGYIMAQWLDRLADGY